MLKIIFLGDVAGRIGRESLKKQIPNLKKKYNPDLIIANAENSAHGKGVSVKTLQELQDYGIDFFTSGDHAFDVVSQINDCFEANFPIIRPANYSQKAPGKGYSLLKTKKGDILVINLLGRVFMKMDYECPFLTLDKILANFAKQKLSAIIIDIHAEASSEKIAMKHYADGRVSAVLGTHTHVQTADEQISTKKTAFISDVGMCGFADGCIGIEKETVIDTFLDQIKRQPKIPEKGKAMINGVYLEIDSQTGQSQKIQRINIETSIK